MNLTVEQQDRTAVSDTESVRLRRNRMKKSSQTNGAQNVEETAISSSAEYSWSMSRSISGDGGDEELSCPLEQHHQGKKLLQVIVALPIDYIFSIIFVQDQVMQNVYEARKTTDVVNGPWGEDQETGQMSRDVTYQMSINVATFGSKTSFVVEKQWLQHSQAGQCYVVATEVCNNGIPYADSFSIFCHYCLIKQPDGRTKLTVWTLVKYKKPVWAVVKSMLEKNAYNGVEAFQAELLSQITLVVERSERKGNKPQPSPSRSKTHVRSSSYGYKRQRPQGPTTKEVNEESKSAWNLWIIISMILAFSMLIFSNYILYNKLLVLERRSEQEMMKTKTNKFFDSRESFGDRKNFWMQNQNMQSDHIQIWKDTVQDASQRLLQIQESLELTLKNIRENEDVMYSTLQKQQDENTSRESQENDTKKINTNDASPTDGAT